MEIVLLERIENLGPLGAVVQVKPGYARNFLLPKKKALRATAKNLEIFALERARIEAENARRREEAEHNAQKMEGIELVLIRAAGESGHLYGSVMARDVAQALSGKGFTISKSQVLLGNPIKVLGIYQAQIALHPEVVVPITLNIAKSTEEAIAQAKQAISA